jgi:peptidylprolyl isomerase
MTIPMLAAAALTLAEILQASPAADWRPVEPEDTLYLQIPSGRVVIELAPSYAPANVAAVKKRVREGYFDGAAIIRSQDNYVVQWARGEEDPKAKALAGVKVKPEFHRVMEGGLPFTRLGYADTYAPEVGFSGGFAVARDPKKRETWLVHCYGSVGVGRDNAADSGNGAELYAVIGQSPRNLDRNITLVGRVIQGMEKLSVMPRGAGPMGFYEKPSEWTPIQSMRVAADVPAAERPKLEALRTDSKTFRTVVDTRATRREPWFHDPVGRIGVCNVPLPVRERK